MYYVYTYREQNRYIKREYRSIQNIGNRYVEVDRVQSIYRWMEEQNRENRENLHLARASGETLEGFMIVSVYSFFFLFLFCLFSSIFVFCYFLFYFIFLFFYFYFYLLFTEYESRLQSILYCMSPAFNYTTLHLQPHYNFNSNS